MPEMKNLIIDPSLFAHSKSISSLLESDLPKEYRIVIPTLIHKLISDKNYQGFVRILGKWEQQTDSQLEGVWAELLDLSPRILKDTKPCSFILQSLDPEKRSILEKIDSILAIPEDVSDISRLCLDMAKENLKTACVASLIVSVSNKAKDWYSKFSHVIVKRVEDNDKLMKAKEEVRSQLRQTGWKGSVLIWLCKHVPIPFAGDLVNVVLILSTNGAYRCLNCGKSLYRLPKDIAFCPYCSKPI